MSHVDSPNSFLGPFPAPVCAPEFPPPLFRQPPTPNTIRTAFSSPPFNWNGIPLRIFRSPTSLSEFAKFEEQGEFLGREHKYWYKILKSALESDLQDLKRRHDIETKLQPSLRAMFERKETARFHAEFMEKLQWGQESSPLLLRPAEFLDNEYGQQREDEVAEGPQALQNEEFHTIIMDFKKQGLDTEFPSIRTFFGGYPGPSVAWAVQDFYRRQETARESAKIGLEFQQMWEWSERHWNFFEASSKLRQWVQKLINKQNRRPTRLVQEYSMKTLNWSPAIESHKRRHQWAVLKRIMNVYECRDEIFPEVSAPAGRTFDRYFGSLILQQIDGAESVLEAGGSLAEACAGVVDGCMESTSRRRRTRTPASAPPRLPGPPRTLEEAEETLVRLRASADLLFRNLVSKVRNVEASSVGESSRGAVMSSCGAHVESATVDTVTVDSVTIYSTAVGSRTAEYETTEELPDPTDETNGDAKVNTVGFLAALRHKLIGPPTGNPESEPPVEEWLTSWRNPRAQWPSGLMKA
ncbi:uncharacterized protein H6S33_006464 [Morchella sextelata]|uniref:uncharacterized protein n=1 Tax=Morchella sextelata TaxID=1174677 RepID=UPI001D051CBD|nr:uncharacterized protein H6S33_006464 [Morchella sextelata]KAH0604796.1 hypothetical protein H6S33_006464 [Morchella sextelata]